MDFFIVSIWQLEAFQNDYIFCIQNSKPWYKNHSFQLRTSISKYLCQFSGSTCSLSSTRISCYCCHLLVSLKFFVISIEGHNLDNPYLNLNLQPKYITVVTIGWSKPSIPGNEFYCIPRHLPFWLRTNLSCHRKVTKGLPLSTQKLDTRKLGQNSNIKQ